MAFDILKPKWGAERPICGVLFDMDGVVVDTEKLFTRFWMEACLEHGFPMTREQALQMRSLSRDAGQAKLWQFFGPEVDYNLVRSTRIRRMSAFIAEHGVEPKPGIRELLQLLKEKGIPCAITSSSPAERIREYLTPLGIYHQFDRIVSGHNVPRGKPAPDIYLHGAAALGLEPQLCMAVEDSPAGILSAFRAGCRTLMVPDQDQPDDTTAQLLWAKADSLGDIAGYLRQVL